MIDVVDVPTAITQFDENLDYIHYVTWRQGQLLARLDVGTQRPDLCGNHLGIGKLQVFRQRAWPEGETAHQVLNHGEWEATSFREVLQCSFSLGSQAPDHHFVFNYVGATEAAVELHPADAGEIITIVRVEQPVEEDLHSLFRRRLTGAHHAVNGNAGSLTGYCFVGAQGAGNECTAIKFVGVEGFDRFDTSLPQIDEQGLGDFGVGIGDEFSGFLVDDVPGDDTAENEILGNDDLAQ